MSENEITTVETAREAAIRSVKAKREFRSHLGAYVAVNCAFWALWGVIGATAGHWYPWPFFPMIGWGIGLVIHAWNVYGSPARPITEQEIEREEHRLTR